MSSSNETEKTIGEKLCIALKRLISNKDMDVTQEVYVNRVLNHHPTSLKAYMRIVGGFIESERERNYNIEEANTEDNIPIDIDEAWEYLSNNPILAVKYIKNIQKSEYVLFSQEVLLEYVN